MDGVKMTWDVFQTVYERGAAVCQSDVKTDTVICRFKDEVFTFPADKAWRITHWNGYFMEADIDEVRKLEAEQARG